VAVLAIAKWDKAFDREKFYRYLASKGTDPAVPGKAGDVHEAAGAAARK
jgi:hypothetical protein